MVAYTYYESDPRVIREAEAALAGGFEVDVLALRKIGTPPTETVRGVRVIRVNQAKYRGGTPVRYLVEYAKFFVRCLATITNLFIKRRYGLIHVNNMPDCLVFSTIVPRLCGAKVILDIHDPMPETLLAKFGAGEDKSLLYRGLLWQERLSATYSNRVITVSQPVKEGILEKHGLAADAIDVVANFADGDLFPLRASYDVGARIRFVFHGTILERSGLRMLITALTLVEHNDRIGVTLIGEGDFSDELAKMIRDGHLEHVVEFDNRSYPVHAIAERIESCNVGLVPLVVSPATMYSLPLKLLEYISLGLPVVSVRNEAISYYLDEEDCMFFDWNDPYSLSSTIDAIVDNPESLTRYRNRSVALRERFAWSGEREKYLELLRDLGPAGRNARAGAAARRP
jgi:glycosyltransferase involved in cell wall biosynthesis